MTNTLTVDQVIETYLRIRNQKEAIDAKAKEDIRDLKDKMLKLEAWIQQQADATGVTSFKTNHGTAFLSSTDFAQVADWDATLEFIREGDHYDMLERRVNKKAVRAYIDEEKAVPPGVNFGTKISVSVRKPAKKAD